MGDDFRDEDVVMGRRSAPRAPWLLLLAFGAIAAGCSKGGPLENEGDAGGSGRSSSSAGRGGTSGADAMGGSAGDDSVGAAGEGGMSGSGEGGMSSGEGGMSSGEAGVAGSGKSGSAGRSGAAGSGSAGAGGASTSGLLQNPSFEQGLLGWTTTGDTGAAYVESLNPHSGRRNLAVRSAEDYDVTTKQTLDVLDAGMYTLRAWLESSAELGDSYVFWRDADGDEKTATFHAGLSSALRVSIGDIAVTRCPCTVGVHVRGPAGSWAALDDVELIAGAPESDPNYLLGGDITFRRQLRDAGVRFSDREGNEADVLDVLHDAGARFVRIRIYNDPGSPDHFPSNQFAAGYQNLPDALANARDAAERGMKLLISFHYSDYWTNPGTQYKPHEWENLTVEELAPAVYAFTHASMTAFEAQGTPPEIVTLGNETNAGMLWPEGKIGYAGENFVQFATLFNAASAAVKDVFPTVKVAVHLSQPDQGLTRWLRWAEALDYDAVGITLYPFWSNLQVGAMKQLVQDVSELTGKPVFAPEVGFPWSLSRSNGFPTMIASNGLNPQGTETFGVSREGQERYLRSLFQNLHEVPGFIGATYWDPIWIDTPELPSNVGDTALFDESGSPLPALNAFEEKFW